MARTPRRTLSNSRKISLICVIGLAIFIIILSGAPMISKPIVEAQLKRFNDYIAAQAQQDGGEASLTHEGVTVEGWGYGKKAIVAKPTFTMAAPASQGQAPRQTLQVSTGSVAISADNTMKGKYYIDLPEPLSLSENGAVASTVQFQSTDNKPLRVGVEQRMSGDSMLLLPYEVQLPPQVTITYADTNQKPTVITYSSPVVHGWLLPVSGANSGEVSFQNVQINEQGGAGNITIGSFASTMKRAAPENGRTAVENTVVVNDLAFKNAEKVQGPFSFKLALDGSRAVQVPGTKGTDADYNLRELSFSSDQLTVNAGGAFSWKPDDFLPFGNVEFTLRNVSAFLAGDMLKPQDKTFVTAVLQRITGTDPATAQELKFTVNREKQGTLRIGNSTLEELMMALLTRAMGSAPAAPPAAAVPAPDSSAPAAPAAAPAPVAPAAPAVPAPAQ